MSLSYNALWKILIDKKLSHAELRRMTGTSPNTRTKLKRGRETALTVSEKLCNVSGADIKDIVNCIRTPGLQ